MQDAFDNVFHGFEVVSLSTIYDYPIYEFRALIGLYSINL